MTDISENPFASPESSQDEHPQSSVYRDLIPLWTWLGVTVVGSVGITPADPVSMLLVLLPSVVSLWVGLGLVTSQSRILQAILLLLVVAPIAWLAMHIAVFYPWGGLLHVGMNVSLATFAAWRLGKRRLKVLTYFSIGFLLGSFLMCFGTIAGAVLGSLLAVRSGGPPVEVADDA